MNTRTARYVVNVVLVAAVIAAVGTGIVVDQLDLHGFGPHRWAGYALATFATLHIAMHWRGLLPSRMGDRRAPHRQAASIPSARSPSVADEPRPDQFDGPTGRPGEVGRVRPGRRSALVAAGAGAVLGWSVKATLSPTPYPGGDVGLFYHRQSSLGLPGLISDLLDWGRRPVRYKQVTDAEPVALPAVIDPPRMTVAQALEQRRSRRTFVDRALTTDELAWVVSAATSITSGDGRRTAPSAGALYPIETYVAVDRVTGLDAGLYHVDVRGQSLERLRAGSVGGDLSVAGLGQEFLRQAPVVLVLTGVFQRTRWKYRQRHYRYVCWEGGHIAQNVYLAAEAAGLGACMVGSFLDGSLNSLLQVDGREEAAFGLIAVGAR
jgi:SagB-type dehydrogenase family enzyme